ncbi:MAG TPA: hypothetical protein VL197_14270 [Nitrospirota bacterium]|nr:hypothetical protein [Nitrospirota bacterium]
MDINGINMLASQADGSQLSARKGNSPVSTQTRSSETFNSSATGSSGIREPQVMTSLTNTNYIKDQLKTIMFSFPPFFPLGSPQRLDLIKGIKGVQEEIGKSSLPPELKEKLTANKLTDKSTDREVSAALADLKQYKETISPKRAQTADHVQHGTIVNVKI